EEKDLTGEQAITVEHISNNKAVRNILGKRGIKPEELPPAEDIKKLERRVSNEDKNIEQTSKKLPKRKK
ncbi:MAG: DNA damage-inducible protein D, partial [Prevotellaceae bacterium]|nr:DNA damage-inducible protein D [Prevotellaceae bacterium]